MLCTSHAILHNDREVPGLRLGFALGEDDHALWSHQYRGMQVDEDQSLDTLVGFENKSMVRKGSKPHATHRKLLLLEADVGIIL